MGLNSHDILINEKIYWRGFSICHCLAHTGVDIYSVDTTTFDLKKMKNKSY